MTHLRLLIGLLLLVAALAGCSEQSSSIAQDQYQDQAPAAPPAEQEGGPDADELGVPPLQKPGAGTQQSFNVEAGADQFADANVLVGLHGAIENTSDVPLVSAHWVQESGTAAALLSPRSLRSDIILPDVLQSETLVFRLYGVNAAGYVESDTARVYVKPLDRLLRVIHATANEQDGTLDFTMRLNRALDTDVSVSYHTESGTAVAGEDFNPVAGEWVFSAGDTAHTVSVPLLDDQSHEYHEYFELHAQAMLTVNGEAELVSTRGLAVIEDDEPVFRYPTTEPLYEGPTNLEQAELPGDEGPVRMQLMWPAAGDDLNLYVLDPCGNRLSERNTLVTCEAGSGQLQRSQSGAPWESIFWPEGAPAGWYSVGVEHYEGLPADYHLRVFVDEQSHWFSGTVGRGDSIEVFRFEYSPSDEPVTGSSSGSGSSASSSSSSSASTSSSSASSSASSTSSTSSSSSSASSSSSSTSSSASSTSSNSSSSSSTSASSSSSSSSSTSSSSSSSSGVPLSIELSAPLAAQGFYFEVPVEGSLSWDPAATVASLNARVAPVQTPGDFVQIPLALSEGRFSGLLDIRSLAAGPLLVTVTASDSLGQANSITTRVEKRVPGELTVEFMTTVPEEPVVVFDALALEAMVHTDAILPLADLRLEVFQEGLVESLPVIDSLNVRTQTATPVFERDATSLVDGDYSLRLVATDSAGRKAMTRYLPITLHTPTAPQIELTQPLARQYNNDIPLRGQITVDRYAKFELRAELSSEITEFAAQPVELGMEGNTFFADINAADLANGTYTVTVFLDDGLHQNPVSESITFQYRAYDELAVQLLFPESEQPAELINSRHLIVHGLAATDELAEVTALDFYLADSATGGFATDLSLLEWQAYDAEQGEFLLELDLLPFAMPSGVYDLWVVAEDSLGRQAPSRVAQIAFEQFIAPAMNASVFPVDETQPGFEITGTYSADARGAPVTLSYSLALENEKVIDSAALRDPEGSFAFFLEASQIPVGTHPLTLMLTDALGQTVQSQLTLNKSLAPPALDILRPQTGVVIVEPEPLMVRVSVDFDDQMPVPEWSFSEQLEVIANDQPVQPEWGADESGAYFSLPVAQLNGGENTLTVVATDPRNPSVTSEDALQLRFEPSPEVSIVSPESGATVYVQETAEGGLRVAATVALAGQSLLDTVAVQVNGQRLPDQVFQQVPAGSFDWVIAPDVFELDAANEISVEAVSDQGVRASESIKIMLWSERPIQFLSPENGQAFGNPFDVTGRLRADVADGAEGVAVRLNGEPLFDLVSLRSDNAFYFTVPEQRLKSGDTYELTAEVTSGESVYSESISVQFDASVQPAEGGDILLVSDQQALSEDNLPWLTQWFDFTGAVDQNYSEVWLDYSRSNCRLQCDLQQSALRSAAKNAGLTAVAPELGDGVYTQIPARVKAVVIVTPMREYGGGEIDALRDFLARGGRLVLVSEYMQAYSGIDGVLNPLLTQLGVESQFNDAYDSSVQAPRTGLDHRLNNQMEAISISYAGGITVSGHGFALYESEAVVAALAKASPSVISELQISSPKPEGQYVARAIPLQWAGPGGVEVIAASMRLSNALHPSGRETDITACAQESDCMLSGLDLTAENVLEVTVTDRYARVFRGQTVFNYDFAPRIEIFNPTGAVNLAAGEGLFIAGRVTYATEDFLGLSYSVNNLWQEVKVDNNGEFEFTIAADAFFAGSNPVSLLAYDQYERSGSAIVEVEVDERPVVVIETVQLEQEPSLPVQ